MKNLYYILAYFTIIATVLTFIPNSSWYIKVLEFPRFQFFIVGLVAVGVLFTQRKFDLHIAIVTILLTASLAYQFLHIYPYTLLADKQVEDAGQIIRDRSISLLIANVEMDNNNAGELLKLIYSTNPDIVIAQETNEWWVEKLKVLEKVYSYKMYKPQENTYGMALFSKMELIEPEFRFLIDDDIPSIRSLVKLWSGDTVETFFLHPPPPLPLAIDEINSETAELIIIGKDVKDSEYPVIVGGDINDVAWSNTTKRFLELSGLLDPRAGRGFFNTYHVEFFFLRYPLDYIFHSEDFKLIRIELLPDFGSDHFPMFIELLYQSD